LTLKLGRKRILRAGSFLEETTLGLIKAVLATVALFVAVGAWKAWFDTLFYCSTATVPILAIYPSSRSTSSWTSISARLRKDTR
jgi:hypothetical protein